MSNDWIKCEDKMPDVGQKVWYYFEPVGRHRGTFDGWYVDEEGKQWNGMHVFSCSYGWLTGDVTHWHEDQEEVPDEPITEFH